MKLTYQIREDILLRDFLKQQDISDKLLSAIKNQGDILVNHCHQTVRYKLSVGDQVEVIFPQEKRGMQLEPYYYDLKIIYEDDYLLVIDKPAGMPCIPDHRYHDKTLANALIYHYDQIRLESTIHFVNRLDKETSGLLIVAKYRYIHYLLSKKHICRKYLAYIQGEIEKQTICLPIFRSGKSVVRCIDQRGKTSITHCIPYKMVESNQLIECQLETGRTHQIRVHLSAIGHPLIGDHLYGGKKNEAGTYYLHSYFVEFEHPITHQTIKLNSMRDLRKKITSCLD